MGNEEWERLSSSVSTAAGEPDEGGGDGDDGSALFKERDWKNRKNLTNEPFGIGMQTKRLWGTKQLVRL